MAKADIASLPRGESFYSDVPSVSSLGPSPSERFAIGLAQERDEAMRENSMQLANGFSANSTGHGLKPTVDLSAGELAEIAESVQDARRAAPGDEGSDDGQSVMTVSQTVTRLEDLPDDKSQAIGTVLVEQKPRPVPLMVEFLGSSTLTNQATRAFVNELYDADLELTLECQFLPKVDLFSNSDPYAELFTRVSPRDPWRKLGRTETIVNAHFPRFVSKFKLSAMPDTDMEKQILVRLFAKGLQKPTRLGEAVCSIWDIASASGHCKVMKMERSYDPKKDSWIILTGDVSRDKMHALAPRKVTFHLKFDATARPRSKTHFVVSRGLKKGRWTPIYRSEGHANPDREFVPAELTFADVFCGDERKPARIEFYQKRMSVDPKLAGFVQFSIAQLEAIEPGMAMQWWGGQDAIPPGIVKLAKKQVSPTSITLWLAVTNE